MVETTNMYKGNMYEFIEKLNEYLALHRKGRVTFYAMSGSRKYISYYWKNVADTSLYIVTDDEDFEEQVYKIIRPYVQR